MGFVRGSQRMLRQYNRELSCLGSLPWTTIVRLCGIDAKTRTPESPEREKERTRKRERERERENDGTALTLAVCKGCQGRDDDYNDGANGGGGRMY